MATDINRIVLSGNLTREPEMRYTSSGMAVMSCGLAVNGRRKNSRTGEWEDYADFVDFTMFGKRAEGVNQYLDKGMKVFIAGSLRYSSWEKDGQKRSKHEVIADDIVFTGSGQNNQQQGYQPPQQYGNQYGQQYAPPQQYGQQQGYGQPPQPAQPYQPQGYQQGAPQQPAQPYQPQIPVIDASTSVYDDDIPF